LPAKASPPQRSTCRAAATAATRTPTRTLTRQSLSALAQAPRGIAWHTTPSTYVVCAEDRATLPERQRTFAERADHVVEIPTGHHPFLSDPDLFAQVIASVTKNVRPHA